MGADWEASGATSKLKLWVAIVFCGSAMSRLVPPEELRAARRVVAAAGDRHHLRSGRVSGGLDVEGKVARAAGERRITGVVFEPVAGCRRPLHARGKVEPDRVARQGPVD